MHEHVDQSLGQPLYERTMSFRDVRGLLVGGIIGLLGGLALSIWIICFNSMDEIAKDEDLSQMVFAGPAIVAGSLMVLGYGWSQLHTSLCCFEHGVVRKSLFGTSKLRYDELDALAFSKQSQFNGHGEYVGTNYLVRFDPKPSTHQRSISFFVPLGESLESQVESMRDHVADIVAGRLIAELSEIGVIQWTMQARITRDGVEYTKGKERVFIPWERMELGFVGDRWFQVADSTRLTHVVRIPQIAPNFYPGLLVVISELSKRGAEPLASLQRSQMHRR